MLLAIAPCNFSTSQLQKVLRTPQFFNMFTCKCTSRYSGVPFFHIWTSKRGPPLRCFVHFDLKMCFSPQRRAIFRHQNLKKCILMHFDLQMCFSLQRRANFRHQNFKSGRNMQCFLLFDLKTCFSLQRRAIFFISPPNSYLRTRRLTKPTFRPSRATNH